MEPRKIIWAVDPFAKSIHLQRSAAYAIRSIQEDSLRPTIVQPIYYSERYPRSIPHATLRFHHERVENDAKEHFKRLIKSIQIQNLRALKFVPTSARSVRQLVDELIASASREKGDLIVLSSRTGPELRQRFRTSFAESLLLYSPIPVMVVNPKWRHRGTRFQRVLFPTDFSEESFHALHELLPMVSRWGAKLVVFHKVQYDLQDVANHARTLNMKRFYSGAYSRYLESLHKKAEKWQLEAKHYGIISSVHFDYRLSGDVAASILEAARSKADLLAMAAITGARKTKLIGSVTRQLVRKALCPVWIVRPRIQSRVIHLPRNQIERSKAA